MHVLLAAAPPTTDRIASNTADALKDNESQALVVLGVIGAIVLIAVLLTLVFRKKSPARR